MPRTRLDPTDPILASPGYPHGERTGYERGCSCPPCCAANARRVREYNRRAERVRSPRTVEPTRTVQHIAWLMETVPGATRTAVATAAGSSRHTMAVAAAGKRIEPRTERRFLAVTPADVLACMRVIEPTAVFEHVTWLLGHEAGSLAAIADATGLDGEVIRRCARREQAHLRADTARIILAVTPQRMRRCAAHVPNRRAIQRCKSLMANGWRMADLNAHLGYRNRSTGLPFLSRPGGTITQDLDRRVEAMYADLGDRCGPSEKTARMMRSRGWLPPIYYDDDGHLIPGSVRDEVGDRRSAEAEAAARRNRNRLCIAGLAAAGWTNSEIARLLGCSHKEVERRKGRRGDGGIEMVGHPDPDGLAVLIEQAAAGVVVDEALDLYDRHGVDYEARWKTLVVGALALRDAAGRAA